MLTSLPVAPVDRCPRPALWRRTVVVVSSAALLTCGVLVPAAPAAAASTGYLTPTSWAYTDSRAPKQSLVDTTGDAPIGAWRDETGRRHRSRSYFTFDVSGYRGSRIVAAHLVARETAVADCSTARSWELWTTDQIGPTTSWAHPPRELTKVADIGGTDCPGSAVDADLTEVVAAAVAAGRSSLTLELRVPQRLEGNVHLGRRIDNRLGVSVTSNVAPGTPTGLAVAETPCAGTQEPFVPTTRPTVTALITDRDTDGETATPTFAVWPVDTPAARVEWTGSEQSTPFVAVGELPAGILVDGGSYAVAVRAADAHDTSSWSAECRFTVDIRQPEAAPGVSSSDYPEGWDRPSGGPGIPGAFTFTPSGVADVAGYRYTFGSDRTYVAAPSLGAPLTVSIAPPRAGPIALAVQSVDRAGNLSDPTEYWMSVRDTAPAIVDENPEAWAGEPRTIRFEPNMEDVVSYTYRVDDEAELTVRAEADGTARVTLTPGVEGATVHAYSTTAAGLRSGESWQDIRVVTAPRVTSPEQPSGGADGAPPGTPSTFTFAPGMRGVVEYVYQFNRLRPDEQPEQTVAAGADGTATVRFTPTRAGYNRVDVFSRTADGFESATAGYVFYPASIAPKVTSVTYPAGSPGGGPGVPGTFTFTPVAADVVEYTYSFAGEPVRTVAAGPDGSASVEWTPTEYPVASDGWIVLEVRSRSANDLVSDWAYYGFEVAAPAPAVTSDLPG